MRTFIILFTILIMVVGCVKKAEYQKQEPFIGIDPKFFMTEDFVIPILPNKITVVTETHEDGFIDTVAITDIPATIQIPIQEKSTRAALPGNFNINYYDSFNNHTVNTAILSRNLLLLFEDTRRADYDYNDVVLFVRHTITETRNGNFMDLKLKPIANGGSKQGIQFGVEIDTEKGKSTEVILTTDVTRDYFNGEKGMNTKPNTTFVEPIAVGHTPNATKNINGFNCTIVTDPSTMAYSTLGVLGGYIKYPQIKTTQKDNNTNTRSIKYFITVEGEKYYVALVNTTIQTIVAGKYYVLPYGLALANGQYYSVERTPIWMAYPKFAEWIDAGKITNWDNSSITGYAIKENLYPYNANKLLRW